jgi:hypothetical protein
MFYKLGSYLFLLGCLFFMYDAYKNKNNIYMIGSLLFTLGTVFYILDSYSILSDYNLAF